MKFASRFGLVAVATVVAVTTLSCTSQSPSGPAQADQSLQRGIGGYNPPPDAYDSDDLMVSDTCQLSLVDPAAEILCNTLPFNLPWETMSAAGISVTRCVYSRLGCLTRVEGSVYFNDTGRGYTFEIQIYRTTNCARNGGYIKVCSPWLGTCKWLRLPAITSVGTVSGLTAN